jgi:hypothetical protein
MSVEVMTGAEGTEELAVTIFRLALEDTNVEVVAAHSHTPPQHL